MPNKQEDSGYMQLAKAIYRQAKLDYYYSLAANNQGRRTEVIRFFKNDPYILTVEEGEDVINTLHRRYTEAVNYIEDFIKRKVKEENIPLTLDRDALFILFRNKYKRMISVVTDRKYKKPIHGYLWPLLIKRKAGKKHE